MLSPCPIRRSITANGIHLCRENLENRIQPGHFENIIETGKTGVTATQNIAAFNPATGDLAWVI